MTAFAAQGRDIRLSEDRIEGYRHFVNKLWNAARFALMHIKESRPQALADIDPAGLALPHRWILSRTSRTINDVCRALDEYRFNDAAHGLYQFVWHEFCDWYLEWIKQDLYGEAGEGAENAKSILFTILETILKLAHPVMPFVTEEIWHVLPGARASIMLESFPEAFSSLESEEVEQEAELVMGVIGGLRNIRSETGIHPSTMIEASVICHDRAGLGVLEANSEAIRNLARVDGLQILEQGERPPGAASYIYKHIEIFVPLAGLVDIEKELANLAKQKEKVESQLKTVASKLGNKKFLAHAPEAVVLKEKNKETTLGAKLAKLNENMEKLASI
jgi:valyl-tRNA synthetase